MRLPLGERHADPDEAGFTLIEVLVAVTIEALIMTALAMAFIAILRGGSQVSQSLSRSGDARIAAHYIVSDARNSSGPQVSLSDTTSCPDPSPPVSGTATAVVRFNWIDTSDTGITTSDTVNYVLVSNSLLRRQCKAGVLVSDDAIAKNIQSISVACTPTANCTGSPTSITVTITETATTGGPVYSYSLTGSFQQLDGAGPPTVASSTILLGAAGSCGAGATGIDLAGGAHLSIFGGAYINTSDGSSCTAMNISNGASYSAGTTSILSGGSCVGSPQSLCPTATSYSPAIADPYAGYTPPSTSGLTARTGCSGTAQPGIYAATLSATSGACTLASGVYVLQAGLTISNGASLTTASGGVFIYMTGGAFTVGGGAPVTLTAMTTGTYSGLAFWQAAADTQTISWANGGTLIFNGAIYAPKAQLNIQGGSVTPTVTQLVVQTIVMANAGGLTVGVAQPLTITTPATLPSWTVNEPLYPNPEVTSTGGDGISYIWSATGLPAGLSMSSLDGVISGEPTAAGTSSVTVSVTDASGDTPATMVYSLVINAAPSVTTTTLPNGEPSQAYSTTLAGSGGTTPYTWSATGLPAGLSINSSTGVISGTPTGSPGTATVTATLTDAAGATDSNVLSLTTVAAPQVTTTSLANGELTVAYSKTLAASGGVTPYTWSRSSGTLPAGLTLSSAGVISGTPTAAGTSSFVVAATDALGGSDTQSLSITVTAAPTISTASPLTAGEKTAPYSVTLAGTSGTTPYTWSLSSGTLPTGLTISSAGVISGTPTATGTSTPVIKLTDAAGAVVTKTLSITINAQPTITSVTLANKSGGTAGKMEAGDKITIVYSAQMKVAGFCSAWSGDTTNQSLSGTGTVVSVTDGGSGNDTLTVTSSTCTSGGFNFGTLNMGSSGYVTANSTFGNSTTNTTIAWTASTHTMVITFGATSASPGTVTSSAPVYTASASQLDSNGGALSNSPFTLASAKQF